jgi:hypothetical protein
LSWNKHVMGGLRRKAAFCLLSSLNFAMACMQREGCIVLVSLCTRLASDFWGGPSTASRRGGSRLASTHAAICPSGFSFKRPPAWPWCPFWRTTYNGVGLHGLLGSPSLARSRGLRFFGMSHHFVLITRLSTEWTTW